MPKRAPREVFARRINGRPGLVDKLLDVIGDIPTPREGASDEPRARSRAVARLAAAKAASTAGAMALPPGPLGWLTIAPELYAVWKIQAQMVSDIAGVFGRPELLSREQMLYCLYGHTAAGAFRGLVIRVGQRYVVRRAPLSTLYAIGNKIAIRIAQRSASRVITRWIPALGALGVAGYVYVDTGRVADACIDLFASDLLIEGELEDEGEVIDVVASKDAADQGSAARSKRAKAAAGTAAHPAAATAVRKSAAKPGNKASTAKNAASKRGTRGSKAKSGSTSGND
jgi:hypothetical protein